MVVKVKGFISPHLPSIWEIESMPLRFFLFYCKCAFFCFPCVSFKQYNHFPLHLFELHSLLLRKKQFMHARMPCFMFLIFSCFFAKSSVLNYVNFLQSVYRNPRIFAFCQLDFPDALHNRFNHLNLLQMI